MFKEKFHKEKQKRETLSMVRADSYMPVVLAEPAGVCRTSLSYKRRSRTQATKPSRSKISVRVPCQEVLRCTQLVAETSASLVLVQ